MLRMRRERSAECDPVMSWPSAADGGDPVDLRLLFVVVGSNGSSGGVTQIVSGMEIYVVMTKFQKLHLIAYAVA